MKCKDCSSEANIVDSKTTNSLYGKVLCNKCELEAQKCWTHEKRINRNIDMLEKLGYNVSMYSRMKETTDFEF